MRICYQNLQRLGVNSAAAKRTNIIQDLRNFSMWWPDLYCFVEFGISNGDAEFQAFGRDLFAPSGIGSKRWGFDYDYCDPHKQGILNHQGDETFAVFRANKSSQQVNRIANLLQYEVCTRTINPGPQQIIETFGTRQFARMRINNQANTDYFDLLLAHPSPANAGLATTLMMDYIRENYVAQQRKFILVGDFNVKPDDPISTRGKDTLKTLEQGLVNKRSQATPWLVKKFAFWKTVRTVQNAISLREISEYRGFALKNAGADTHENQGEIDFLFHSNSLTVSRPGVLGRTKPCSDHNAIYFDVTW